VLLAISANLGLALAKFAAAGLTGSSAMQSEAIHSLVCTSSQALLLYGARGSARTADQRHPFAATSGLYFWSFVVAVLLFAMGAGTSIHEGVHRFGNPHPVANLEVNLAVLAVAFALLGVLTWKAIHELPARHGWQGLVAALRSSKDPVLLTVIVETLAALAGLLAALVGISMVHLAGTRAADGTASIVIGLIMAAVAAFMSIKLQTLIAGEAAGPAVQAELRSLISAEVGAGKPLQALSELQTLRLGPDHILVVASLDLRDGETAASVAPTVARLERAIRAQLPEVRHLSIEVRASSDSTETSAGEPPKIAASTAATAAVADGPSAPPAPTPRTTAKPAITSRPPGAKKKGGRHKR
jgi:cation diffusion facilitator family transporter